MRGGRRKGAGRKCGSTFLATAEVRQAALEAGDLNEYFRTLARLANEGNIAAGRLWLEYAVGRPEATNGQGN